MPTNNLLRDCESQFSPETRPPPPGNGVFVVSGVPRKSATDLLRCVYYAGFEDGRGRTQDSADYRLFD